MKSKQLLAFGMVMTLAVSALGLGLADNAAAEYTDMGEYYSDTLQFVYSGEYAQNVYWDFGDGTEIVDEFNPQHTYAVYPAEYIVTQTATNTNSETGQLQSSTEKYRVYVHGPPILTFIHTSAGAPAFPSKTVPYGTTIRAPDYPAWEGHEFQGYFSDSECTVPYNWQTPITKHTNVYVKWDGGAAVVPDVDDTDDGEGGTALLPAALILLTVVVGLVAVLSRRPLAIVAFVALLAMAAYTYSKGVF